MNTLYINNVKKTFNDNVILTDVNMEMQEGKIYGLIGRNGSGKTVLLKMICGFMSATEGTVYFNQKKLKNDMEFLENTGFLIEHPGFLNNLNALDNLKYIASVNNKIDNLQIKKSIERVGLEAECKKRIGNYSMGMKQRLGIAQAIMENPDILILDEPMNGLDDSGVSIIRALLIELRLEGKLILIASHYKEDIDLLCDSVYCCNNKTVLKIK